MVFLKALIFIIFNLISGYLIVFTGKAILFLPRKPKFWRGKQIIFTPGLLYRKKDWLITKINTIIADYIRDTKSESSENKVSEWEEKAFHKAWDKFNFIEKPKLIPHALKEQIHFYCSAFVYELVKQFLRSFIPYLMEEFKLDHYVDLLNQKLDVDIIYDYFHKYIYKYLLYFSLAFFFLVGFGNMILYFIVH